MTSEETITKPRNAWRFWLSFGTAVDLLLFFPSIGIATLVFAAEGDTAGAWASNVIGGLLPALFILGPVVAWRFHHRHQDLAAAAMVILPVVYAVTLFAIVWGAGS